MSENQWLSVVTIAACLVLVLSGYGARSLPFSKTVWFVLLWIGIFAAGTVAFTAFG